MIEYFSKVIKIRHFWIHLAKAELRNKFRRSKLGLMWTFLSPLLLTAIMSVVFGTVFKSDIFSYAPYILSGLLFWELFSSSLVGGAMIFIANDGYIKQFNHPITIYTLKYSVVLITSFSIAMLSLVFWVILLYPEHLLIGILTFPLAMLLYFALAWACTTISSFTNTKYRDYPQMMSLVMQALWYVSPVFFQENMFESNEYLHIWFQINPLTHILALVREPFLNGQFPSLTNYIVSIIFVALMILMAVWINKKNVKEIIFYI